MKFIALLLISILYSSCEKQITVTCTCRYSTGEIMTQTVKKTRNRDKAEEWRTQCREGTVHDNGNATPCVAE
jgi:hypothetical protein